MELLRSQRHLGGVGLRNQCSVKRVKGYGEEVPAPENSGPWCCHLKCLKNMCKSMHLGMGVVYHLAMDAAPLNAVGLSVLTKEL